MPVELAGYGHIGIRVRDRERSRAFYRALGFEEVAWFEEPRVSILHHPSGIEINLIVNASEDASPANVLMDVPGPKHTGYTHVAFRVPSIERTVAALGEAGIRIGEGPVRLGDTRNALFVRDPDGNVIELGD